MPNAQRLLPPSPARIDGAGERAGELHVGTRGLTVGTIAPVRPGRAPALVAARGSAPTAHRAEPVARIERRVASRAKAVGLRADYEISQPAEEVRDQHEEGERHRLRCPGS